MVGKDLIEVDIEISSLFTDVYVSNSSLIVKKKSAKLDDVPESQCPQQKSAPTQPAVRI